MLTNGLQYVCLLVYDTKFQIFDISNIYIHIDFELINTIVSNQQKQDRHTLPGMVWIQQCRLLVPAGVKHPHETNLRKERFHEPRSNMNNDWIQTISMYYIVLYCAASALCFRNCSSTSHEPKLIFNKNNKIIQNVCSMSVCVCVDMTTYIYI